MTMTENEICRNYRESKDKPAQIKILADLNCTSTGEIDRILVGCGEKAADSKKPEGKKAGRPKKVKEETGKTAPLTAAMPEAVMDTLTAELDVLDMQIKLLTDRLNPLVEKYKEISTFVKTYGRV